MGEAVGVKYHSDDGGSPAPTKNVVKLLQYLGDIGLGYSNIALSPITTDKVRDMIFVKNFHFIIPGRAVLIVTHGYWTVGCSVKDA